MNVYIELKHEVNDCREFTYSNVNVEEKGESVVIRDNDTGKLCFICNIANIGQFQYFRN